MIDCVALYDFNDLLCGNLIEIDLIEHLLLNRSDILFCGNHIKNFDFRVFI